MPLVGEKNRTKGTFEASKGEEMKGTVTAVSTRVQSLVWQIAAFTRRSPSDLKSSTVGVLEAEYTAAYAATMKNANIDDTDGVDDSMLSQSTAPDTP